MQSTWAASSETWGTTHIWANDTYVHNATVAGMVSATDTASLTIPMSVNMTQVLLSELHEEDRVSLLAGTLGSALGFSTDCVLVMPVTATLDSTSSSSSSTALKAVGSISLGSDISASDSATVTYPATATFSSVLDNVDDEDKVTLISAALESTYGIITGSVLKAVGSGTLGSTVDVINNTNYPEAATIGTDVSTSSASNFLWNTETESSDTWSTSTASTTTWTEQIEDNTTWD
jgi:hypothetical protein